MNETESGRAIQRTNQTRDLLKVEREMRRVTGAGGCDVSGEAESQGNTVPVTGK